MICPGTWSIRCPLDHVIQINDKRRVSIGFDLLKGYILHDWGFSPLYVTELERTQCPNTSEVGPLPEVDFSVDVEP